MSNVYDLAAYRKYTYSRRCKCCNDGPLIPPNHVKTYLGPGVAQSEIHPNLCEFCGRLQRDRDTGTRPECA